MIYAVIVTFNPNIFELLNNVNSILPQVDKLIIFDNNSDDKLLSNHFSNFDRCQFVPNAKNIGLGAAYNLIITKYLSEFDYFVTLDQDTFVPENTIKNLINYFNISNVGLVAPFINSDLQFNNKFSKSYKEVNAVIQSCLVIKKNVFLKVGFFNEFYFIDSIDFEFCLRAKKNNFKIIMSRSSFIKHKVGQTKKKFGINYSSHNYKRNYFIARNHILISKEYFLEFPYFIIKKNIFFILHFFKLLFLELDYIKIKFYFKGLIDGLKLDLKNVHTKKYYNNVI